MKSWQEKLYSVHNEVKSVVAERFIGILKEENS